MKRQLRRKESVLIKVKRVGWMERRKERRKEGRKEGRKKGRKNRHRKRQ